MSDIIRSTGFTQLCLGAHLPAISMSRLLAQKTLISLILTDSKFNRWSGPPSGESITTNMIINLHLHDFIKGLAVNFGRAVFPGALGNPFLYVVIVPSVMKMSFCDRAILGDIHSTFECPLPSTSMTSLKALQFILER